MAGIDLTGCGRRSFLNIALRGTASVAIGQHISDTRMSDPKRGPGWVPKEEFLATLPGMMRLASLPGLSMAVIEDGKVVWSKCFGVLNANTKAPVQGDTLFEAASMSKPVFAYAVLQLAEDKTIDLDKPLVGYYRPAYLPKHEYIDQITARHVLTHTTGLPDWGDENKPETLKPSFKPGSYFSYSGEAFVFLQFVIEKMTGKGLDELVRGRLFDPAGMSHSTFTWDSDSSQQASYGHDEGLVASQFRRESWPQFEPIAKKLGKPLRNWTQEDWVRASALLNPNQPAPKRVGYVNCAASLLTTAIDYAKFLSFCVAHEPRRSWEISEWMRRTMVAPHSVIQEGEPIWWGLGWTVERAPGNWLFGHEGNNENKFTCYSGADPERGRGVVILTNGGSGFGVYQRVVRAITGYDQYSFIADMDPPRSL